MAYSESKLAVITGAGSGIGRALAQQLNREGCRKAQEAASNRPGRKIYVAGIPIVSSELSTIFARTGRCRQEYQ